jgi:hypothetical protein
MLIGFGSSQSRLPFTNLIRFSPVEHIAEEAKNAQATGYTQAVPSIFYF